jgi:DNA-3-methyladenine glycosylase
VRVTATATGAILDESFYERSVLDVARDLIGCALLVDGVGGVIVETEAYRADEPACHAYVGLTARSAPLFGPPGHAYVYLSYGIHSCFNVVAEPEGSAAAALIRAIEPRWGLGAMRARRGIEDERRLCSGPGMLTQALGIGLELNTRSLRSAPFELRAPATGSRAGSVEVAPRIGITKATELDWRFCASGSRFLSRPLPGAA